LAAGRAPRLPGPVETRADGRVVAPVFPASLWDRMFFPGVHAEVWMQPGVAAETLAENQGLAHRSQGACDDAAPGRVALVLGAGNVSSIGPMDVLYKLFAELQVVLYKSHPVQDPLGPLFEEAFSPLIDAGSVRVVYGGAEVGEYLVDHEGVDEIHITGSDKTYEAIVFGAGEEGERRKREDRPRLTKRFTAELGNVSPVLVVPGPWSPSDVAYQAENLVSMMANNAGFNCNAVRVVVLQEEWPQRAQLLAEVRRVLAATPTRPAYYPGAADRFETLVAAHPNAELFGEAAPGELPWALLPDLDPTDEDDPAFRMEAFCGLFGETALPAPSAATFLDRAVEFCNERLWGTLNATILIHPDSLADPATAAAYDRALASLRYGTIAVNIWAGVGYGMVTTPWGAFPGHSAQDIQSGLEVVHNTFLFDRPEKSIVRAPFRSWPKPPWFVTHKTAAPLGRDLTRFEAQPSPFKLPAIFLAALRG
ncbi:MAG TPA: aldehyde dehydrogenase family protein, partial [Thermoanaerobaculia bacterium]|nr:aldehyde dehydrogenase family protein [Thermoanaerobaculia bacterium]